MVDPPSPKMVDHYRYRRETVQPDLRSVAYPRGLEALVMSATLTIP